MTEQEWLACTDPRAMLWFLEGKASDRKLRLFGCACCRRIWHVLPDDFNRELVEVVEDYPDGKFEQSELFDAIGASSRRERELGGRDGYWAAKYLGRSFYKMTPLQCVIVVATRSDYPIATGPSQASLVHEIFGNPFRPIFLEPNCLTPTVKSLAQGIYKERAFDRMPILADALEDAGCRDSDILDYCRSPSPHVRGCWVVDLVLGK